MFFYRDSLSADINRLRSQVDMLESRLVVCSRYMYETGNCATSVWIIWTCLHTHGQATSQELRYSRGGSYMLRQDWYCLSMDQGSLECVCGNKGVFFLEIRFVLAGEELMFWRQ